MTNEGRIEKLMTIWPPDDRHAREAARIDRIAHEFGRSPAAVRAEVAALRAQCRAAGARTPEQIAAVLAEAMGLDADAVLTEAARLSRMEMV
jgi:hypothetical protein